MQKKILLITHEASRTGAPMVLLHFSKWIQANKPEVVVDILALNGGALELDFISACHNYYDYNQLIKPKKISVLQRVFLKFGLYKKPNRKEILIQELIKEKYNIVYSNTVVCLALAHNLVSRSKRTHLVAHVHELITMIKLMEPQFNDYKSVVNQFIVPSQLVKTSLVTNWAIPEDKIEVVYECASTTVSNVNPKLIKKETPFIIGASGTVDWRKGYDVFIQVARFLKTNYSSFNFKFVWVGALPATQQIIIEEDIKKLELDNTVVFVGEQANPSTFYEDFDVFLMTSREDPFPLVCIEVGILGKPIISFDKAVGTNEVLKEAGGFIVPYLNVEAMAKKIIEYYKNPSLRAEHGAMNKTSFSQFTPELICPILFDVIQKRNNK